MNLAKLWAMYLLRFRRLCVSSFVTVHGEVEVECIGHRYNVGQGKGLEIPVDYRLLGNQQYLQRVVTKLKSTDLALSISDIRKCGTE